MATITDLRRILSLKGLIILFTVNLFNDIISVSSFFSLKETEITQNGLQYLFNRFFCTEIDLISFAQFISFYGFVIWCIVNRAREDNQKYGIFYIVRYTRHHFALGKLASSFIFLFFTSVFSVFQSYVSHRIVKISVSAGQYIIVMLLSFIIAFFGAQVALFIHSLLKNSNISFLCSFISLTSFSVILSVKRLFVPTENNISFEYIYPLISAMILIIPNYLIMLKNDFITTKIKE